MDFARVKEVHDAAACRELGWMRGAITSGNEVTGRS
jgi:hypothetical protein